MSLRTQTGAGLVHMASDSEDDLEELVSCPGTASARPARGCVGSSAKPSRTSSQYRHKGGPQFMAATAAEERRTVDLTQDDEQRASGSAARERTVVRCNGQTLHNALAVVTARCDVNFTS